MKFLSKFQKLFWNSGQQINQVSDSTSNLKDGDNSCPECFGDPSAVCPRDERGFIQPQAGCISCEVVKTCLQHALRYEGILPDPKPEEEVVSRMQGFFKRWSDKKLSSRKGRESGVAR